MFCGKFGKKKINIQGDYMVSIQSKDKWCLLMYAALPHYVSEEDAELFRTTAMIERILNKDTSTSESLGSPKQTYPRSQISAEIKTALGLYYRHGHPSNNDSVKIDLNDYVTIISGKRLMKCLMLTQSISMTYRVLILFIFLTAH
jgi:hypothetical protein